MKKYIFLLSFLVVNFLWSQNVKKNKVPEWNGSIKRQFEEVFNKSGKYQDYKVIKSYWFVKLKKNTLDSIGVLQKEIKDLNLEIDKFEKQIDELKNDIAKRDTEIQKLNGQKDRISFLGFQMSKPAYNILVWSLIGILFLLLLFFIYRFYQSNQITKETLENYKNLSDEYESFRTQSLERVQALQRKLLDATNNQSANS